MTVVLPLSAIMFVAIGLAAMLGGVTYHCITEDITPLGVLSIFAIIGLMALGVYLCQ